MDFYGTFTQATLWLPPNDAAESLECPTVAHHAVVHVMSLTAKECHCRPTSGNMYTVHCDSMSL